MTIGVSFYLANSREQAVREMRPYYEEHVKMFAPLGFVPGITPAQIEAVARRRLGRSRRCDPGALPGAGLMVRGHPGRSRRSLKSFEEPYPGMHHINLSPPLTTPKDRIVEQYRVVGELVMPHFRPRPATQNWPRSRRARATTF